MQKIKNRTKFDALSSESVAQIWRLFLMPSTARGAYEVRESACESAVKDLHM